MSILSKMLEKYKPGDWIEIIDADNIQLSSELTSYIRKGNVYRIKEASNDVVVIWINEENKKWAGIYSYRVKPAKNELLEMLEDLDIKFKNIISPEGLIGKP